MAEAAARQLSPDNPFAGLIATPAAPALSADNPFAPLIKTPAPTMSADNPFASLVPQQVAPRHESRGFFGELTNNFMSTLIKQNPKLAGSALEGFAELLEPEPAAKAGALVGSMVPPRPGEAPQQPPAGTNRLRQLATALQEYGKKGEEERRPAVPSFWDIRTNEGLGTATQDALDFLGQALGQGGGSSAPGIATGMATAAITKNPIAGFFAGAFGPSFIQNFGDTYSSMLEDKDIQAALKSGKQTKQNLAKIASIYTIPMAGLDSLEATNIFGGLAHELKGNLMKRMLKRGLIGAAMEAPTEGAQQVLQEAALEVGGGKKSFADQVKAVVDATIQGGVGGAGISTLRPGPRAPDEVTPQPDQATPAGDILPPEEGVPTPPGYIRTEDLPPAPALTPEQVTANLTAAWQKLMASGRSLDELRQMKPEETLAAAAALPAAPQIFTGKNAFSGDQYGATVGSIDQGTKRQLLVDPNGGYYWGDWRQESQRDVGAVVGGKDKEGTPFYGTSAEARAAAEQTPLDKTSPTPPAAKVPDSPRLTEADRASPIPNEIIDAGKAAVEQATGKPSTVTTAQEVNGHVQVTDTNVSDIVAKDRAETAALVGRITAGVSVPQISQETGQPAPPASAAALPGVPAPESETPSVGASVAAPANVIPDVLPEARFHTTVPDELTRRFGPPGTQARTLEEARLAKGSAPIVLPQPGGGTMEISHPYYETFEARIDGKKVGELNVSPQGPHASSVTVDPSAQRQGVATALYNAAEAALGRPMTPSPMGMSGDAIGFWKNRMAEMEPEQKQAILQQALDKGTEQGIPKSARQRVDALGYMEPEAAQPRQPAETDKEFAKRVIDKRPQPKELPETYPDYFIMTGAKVVPIGDLVSSKTDEENKQGGGNAVKRMAAAAKGELAKRAPITVKQMPDGKYLITDGNGTYTSVKDYGWKAMPVLVEAGEAPQTKPAATEKGKAAVPGAETPAKPAASVAAPAATAEPAAQKALKQKIADKREAEGDWQKFPTGSTLGIPREQMPQITADKRAGLFDFLKGRGITGSRETISPDKLKPTQAEFSAKLTEKVANALRAGKAGVFASLISSDGYILDGHHRWTASLQTGQQMDVIRLNAPIRELLQAVSEYPGTEYRTNAQENARTETQLKAEAEAALNHQTKLTGEDATPEQEHRFKNSPYPTIDDLYEDAQARQDELVAVGKEIASRMDGVELANPGLKAKKKSSDKIGIKGYKNAGQITDAIRMGFKVDQPGKAGQIIRELAHHFELIDEGWAVTSAGYFDRKVIIKFADGRLAEVQFWEPNLFQAKEVGLPGIVDGVKGHDIYDEWNALRKKDPSNLKLDKLSQQMNELYAHALSLAPDRAWAIVLSEGRLSKPVPKYLNLLRQASSDISRQESYTSPKSASTHSVSPGSSSALASKSVSTTGRMSQLQNFTGAPPSANNVVRPASESKGEEPKFQARTIREGTETPESLGLPQRNEKGKPIRHNTRQIAAALEARQRERYGTVARDDRSPEAQDRISDWIVDEVDFESQPSRQQQSGAGWYSTKFQNALNRFGEVLFPELLSGRQMMSSDLPGLKRLKTKKNARDFLTSIIAVTSDGQLAAQNFENAAKLYNEFRQTGSFDIDKVTFGGDRNLSIKTNLANILHMLATYGPDGMHTTLMREETVSDLKKTAAETGAKFSTQYQAHVRMPLASLVFGPKLGAFYANLMGAHGYLTMDRWWSRTFNRYRGQILKHVTGLMNRPTDKQGKKIGLARFKEMLGKPNLSDEEALVEALHHAKLYEEKGFKGGTDLEKTANTIRKDSIGTEDQPFNATDRTFMIETTEMARQKLAARGVDISLADIQAILWYFEKRLYSELGARATPDVSYEEIANRVTQGAVAGDRSAGSAASNAVEGPDGASFSIGQEGRNQDAGRERTGSQGLVAATPEEFVKARNASTRPGYLSPLAPADIIGHKLFLSPDRTYGVAVDPNGDVQNVFNNGGPKGSGAKAVVAAIENGGRTLDAYSGYLPKYYRQFGFVETGRMPFNPDFAPDGWDFAKNGTPDVVFMAWQGYPDGTADAAINRANSARANWIVNDETSNRVTDWDAAKQESRSAADSRGAGVSQGHDPNAGPSADRSGREPEHRAGETTGRTRLKVGAPAEALAPAQGRTEVKQVRGGQVILALSPQFAPKADAVFKDLRKALDRLGLPNVDIKVWQQIFADMEHGAFGVEGMYLKNLIHIALEGGPTGQSDPNLILHHEAIHALWPTFTENEKAILTRKSKKEWITDKIKSIYPEHQWVEEGVAHAYTDWLEGTRMDGVIAHTFKKIKTILKALYQTLTGHDIRTTDDIFRQVTSGKLGRRATAAQQKALFEDGKGLSEKFTEPSGPDDSRFNLNVPPHNAQQSQQVMQGFLQRGQLLDRAIRVPFALLGGTKDGVFHWGKRLDEKMGAQGPQRREGAAIGGIVGAGIGTFVGGPGLGTAAGAVAGGSVGAYILGGQAWPTGGAFGFFRNFAENAKRGLITNYGLDPEYVETFRQSELYKDMKAREGAGHLKVLHNAGVGTAEAKVLQAILSGEPVNDADMIRLALPIRQAIDDMGAEAVSLGQISAESFERNRGAYLHRVYAKNEVDQSTLSGWVSNKMASRRKKIIGDQLKGRGMFWDLAIDRLMQDAGAHPVPTKGDKWRVLDNTASTGKVMKRVYFPANKPIPMEFSGASWVDRGAWEVRQIGSGKATLWRDYTKAERDKMGEITDARYTIAKTFMLMANDLGTGKFYHDIAAKAEWTQTAEPAAGTWKEGGEYNAMNGRYWEDPDIRWVKVPDTAIPKTGGKKRWGALSGKFVRAEIWRDINELNLANNPGTWRNIYRQWKANHTYRHPVVHMNNVMSNVLFMDMADVRGQDLVGGIKAYFSGGKDYREALDNGAFGADTVSQELRDKVLKPILDEITKQQTGATNPFLAKVGIAGVVADKLWSWAKTADDGMMRAYRAEDEMFRMALYMRRRSLGDSPRRAALEARDQFLNYDIRAPWVVAMRNTLLPFISYTYRAVPMIMHSIQLRPWKIAKYAAVAYAVNALAYMLDDWDDDDKDKKRDGEARERAALQDQEQGYTWIGTPRMVRMPWRDQNGLPVFLDVRRWIPAGDVFDTTQGSAALPMPGPLNFGGPLQLAFEYNLNRKAFSGDDITNDLTQTNAEKFTAVADWAWKAWTPPSFWNPGSYYWAKINNALHGATDAAGHPYTVPQALLSSIGIKVKPVDVENGIMWHYFDFKQVQTALKKDLRALSRQLERGLISQSAFDSGAAKIMDKFETLGQNIDEFSKQTEPPKKGQ